MKIRYIGVAGAREYGAYRWDAGNHFTQAVDAQTALELLTYPTAQFEIAEYDAFPQLVGSDLAVYLMAGVGNVEDLAKLTKAEVTALADVTGLAAEAINERVKAARKLLKEA